MCDCGNSSLIIQGSLTTGNTTRCNDHPKNEYRITGQVAWVDVSTKSQPTAATQIDIDDLEKVIHFRGVNGRLRWIAHDSSEINAVWGNYVFATDRKTRLHRLIMNLDDPTLIIDHINGDTFDNRKSNLRIITRAENNKNMRMHINNTSGGTGVSLDPRNNNFKVNIQLHGKKMFIGTFDSLEHANIAYRSAAKALGFSERHGLK